MRVLFKHELILNTQPSEPLFKIDLFPQTRDSWGLWAVTFLGPSFLKTFSKQFSSKSLTGGNASGVSRTTHAFWVEVLYLLRLKV